MFSRNKWYPEVFVDLKRLRPIINQKFSLRFCGYPNYKKSIRRYLMIFSFCFKAYRNRIR